ncbi:MAG: hypothetical protein K2Y56_20430 [Methylobacterium sp.]|nr:hypothetical protein [Methylobacterium sp.]
MARVGLTTATVALALCVTAASAADLFERRRGFEQGTTGPPIAVEVEPELEPLPRFFPREGSDGLAVLLQRPKRLARPCRPRRVPIPTDAPDDPSYVGSTYGLGKPSYYGFVPALGTDDPFGRSILPYCR